MIVFFTDNCLNAQKREHKSMFNYIKSLKKITKKLTAQKMITNKCPITTNAQIKIKKN